LAASTIMAAVRSVVRSASNRCSDPCRLMHSVRSMRPRVRSLCTPPPRETLLEKNRRLREASEANLLKTRQNLMDDMSKRNADMSALREVIHEKTITLHPPPKSLYKHANAYRFPQLQATSLTGDEVAIDTEFFAGRWSLLGCAGSQFAQPMVDGWMDGVSKALSQKPSPPSLQLRWLSLVDGRLLGWFRRPLLATMRRSVPSERHAAFLCHFGDSTEPRRRLQMQNRYLGFVCAVDSRGVVRWHVHGSDVPDELQAMTLVDLIVHEASRERMQS